MGDGNGMGQIPNRWLKCPRKSSELINNKFIAFKTPLSENFDSQVSPKYRWLPSMMFQLCRAKKINIGLWIDLTNTKRFYSRGDIEKDGCKYLKLSCRGHGETPSPEQTETFVKVCKTFISKNPLHVIAVHCTHGFNRSGFLIVSYLVETQDWAVEGALAEFAKVRPPGIYKQDYLEELYKRYDNVDDTPLAPNLPDWCNEDENSMDRDDYDAEKSENGNCSTGSGQPQNNGGAEGPYKKQKGRAKQPVFMAGVSGVTLFTDMSKASAIQRDAQKMCGWKSNKGFPGCQPVSMDVDNISLLNKKPYRVSWKADGMRYMMMIDGENEIYFLDRDNNVFHVKGIRFPHRNNPDRHLVKTLVDGEMVIDKENGSNIPRYLIYDIICFETQVVWKDPFYPVRLRCIQDELIAPRHAGIREGRINKEAEPFSVRRKDFWDIQQTGNLLGDKFSKSVLHELDGLIFQPSLDPYVAGRCDEVLKWKPLDMNSVDFRLKIVVESGQGKIPCKMGLLYVGQLEAPYSTMKYTKILKDLHNKIIECKLENGNWVFMRERVDKSHPNSYNTAKAVYNSIRNPITKEKLLEFIEYKRYKDKDDSELMPHPAKRARR